jgi:membrane protease YdiL (CAAX protease family)
MMNTAEFSKNNKASHDTRPRKNKIFGCLSPLILIGLSFVFKEITPDFSLLWIVLYWCTALLFVRINAKLPYIKTLFIKSSGEIIWPVIAVCLGCIPVAFFFQTEYFNGMRIALPVMIIFAIVNSIVEEIYWRGFVLEYTFSSKIISAIYSIVLFTAWHFILCTNIYGEGWGYLIGLLIAATAWTIIRIKTKSLWWSIVSHCAVDFFALSIITVTGYLSAAV